MAAIGSGGQTPEVQAFIKRVLALPNGPGVALDAALQPSIDDERELRRYWANERTHPRLNDPYIGLVDVFAAPKELRTIRARVVKDEEDLNAKYVLTLSDEKRKKEGTPSMVNDIDEFKKYWFIFTEGSLSQLTDWNNVIAAGGSVQACLTPLTDEQKKSTRSIRTHYHSAAYPSSDIDLFLWGLTPSQAEEKIKQIYAAVRDSVPWDVTCVRNKHTVSIYSQYPYRSVQIILRLYSSPAEVLAGFDVDAPCFAYDGNRVWANPRAVVSMMRQCNTVDMTRRSPSYEVRLTKYASRGFEVYVPSLRRPDIDPTIYERSIIRIQGLARLLVFEKLADTEIRNNYLEARRTLRSRPNPLTRYSAKRKRKYKNDLKAETTMGGLEMNDYDVASLHIPYGHGWDARRIEKLVYSTDLGMNSTFNPKNKGRRLHRHLAFFGTAEEVLEDCCEYCPIPIDDDERTLQEEEDKQHVRGRLSFLEEDPGRQTMSGSFNPIDVGEWSEQVYIGPVDKIFRAIAVRDLEAVKAMLKEGYDLQRRDYVGRTVLHAAILCGAPDIACELIDSGARMTARLVDGRNSLHLAAQYNLPTVARKLLERSAANKEQAEAKKSEEEATEDVEMKDPAETDFERPSSEDDWSSEDGGSDDGSDGGKKKSRKGFVVVPSAKQVEEENKDSGDIPEDKEEDPDILDLNVPDWDFALTPLHHAIVAGSLPIIDELLDAGAGPNFQPEKKSNATYYHPITATLLCEDQTLSTKIIDRLIAAGSSTTTTSTNMTTAFHHAVIQNLLPIASTLLKRDPKAEAVINFPSHSSFPLATAVYKRQYAMTILLLAYGAKINVGPEDLLRFNALQPNIRHGLFDNGRFAQPLEAAMVQYSDAVPLFVALGANVNAPIFEAQHGSANSRRTYIDWVNREISMLTEKLHDTSTKMVESPSSEEHLPTTWKGFLQHQLETYEATHKRHNRANEEGQNRKIKDLKSYYQSVKKVLVQHGAKTWDEVFPEKPSAARNLATKEMITRFKTIDEIGYVELNSGYRGGINEFENDRYDELFEACFTGDNERVQFLCLPPEDSDQIPLRISVQVTHPLHRYGQMGYTPLYAAIINRQWETGKLVLAITAAQYKEKEEVNKFKTGDIDLDDDSDADSECSEGSDMTVDNKLNFYDIAKRPSTIKTNVTPSDMLDKYSPMSPETKGAHINLLAQAIYKEDFEAFMKIGNLYRVLPKHIEFQDGILNDVMARDHPEMLDQFIRWTGAGLDLGTVSKIEGQPAEITNDQNRIYLGLNVHGKKRMDLARKNAPNDRGTSRVVHPLLWQACNVGAKKIIDYLSGDRPLASYKYYANSNNTEIASRLRYSNDLERVLPEWLGWTVSPLGESALTVAVNKGRLDIIKLLFSKASNVFGPALHQKMKFSGYNLVLLAVDRNSPIDLLKYLLDQSISPVERSLVDGRNVYHICCANNRPRLLEYLLKRLPKDVSEALLRQQSTSRQSGYTPLYLAVKSGSIQSVKLLISFTKEGWLTRDDVGTTPLHLAVTKGFAEITKLLIDVVGTEGLHLENGVGETPLGLARLISLSARARNSNTYFRTKQLPTHSWGGIEERYDLKNLEEEIPKVKAIIQELIQDNKLRPNTPLYDQAQLFVSNLATQLLGAKQSKELDDKIKEDQKRRDEIQAEKHRLERGESKQPEVEDRALDTWNFEATLRVIENAVQKRPGPRGLVHLIDVQRSVQGDLRNASRDKPDEYQYMSNRRRREILEPEQKTETQEKESMFVQFGWDGPLRNYYGYY